MNSLHEWGLDIRLASIRRRDRRCRNAGSQFSSPITAFSHARLPRYPLHSFLPAYRRCRTQATRKLTRDKPPFQLGELKKVSKSEKNKGA
jgi:hypothetical protein